MPLKILPKKNWHVLARKNVERVKRDEAAAEQEQQRKTERSELAEQEARTSLLRKRAREKRGGIPLSGPRDEDFEGPNILSHSSAYGLHNPDAERERKEEKEKMERKMGLLTYLGQSAMGPDKKTKEPWYMRGGSAGGISHSQQSSKDLMDPLTIMKEFRKKGKPQVENEKSIDGPSGDMYFPSDRYTKRPYRSRRPRSPLEEHSRRPRPSLEEHSRRPRSPLEEHSRRPRPSLEEHSRRPRSPLEEHSRRPRPSLEEHSRRPHPSLEEHSRRPRPPLEEHSRRPRSPLEEHSSRPRTSLEEHSSRPRPSLEEHSSRPRPSLEEHSRRPRPLRHEPLVDQETLESDGGPKAKKSKKEKKKEKKKHKKKREKKTDLKVMREERLKREKYERQKTSHLTCKNAVYDM